MHIDARDVYVICLRDTSERVRAEQALRDSEARYRTLVESAPELIVVIDCQSGLFVDANENALRFFGVGRERMLTLGPIDVSLPRQAGGAEAGALFGDLCAQAAAGKPQVFEWLHRDAYGHEVETEVRLMALPGAGHLLRASITDVAGRRRAESITSGERNVFERIAADASLAEVLESIADLIESISGSFTATIGLLAADGQSFAEIIGRRVPEHWRKLEQRLADRHPQWFERRGRVPGPARAGSGHRAAMPSGNAGANSPSKSGFAPPGPFRSRLPTAAYSAPYPSIARRRVRRSRVTSI